MKTMTHPYNHSIACMRALTDGAHIQVDLRHVSRSGLTREIAMTHDGTDISYAVSEVLGLPLGKNGGVVIRGVGMDMGFKLSDLLSAALGKAFDYRGYVVG